MIYHHELQYWIDVLAEQIAVLEALYSASTGEPHLANPELVAFLHTNDALLRERVERAVSHFAERGVWPGGLKADQIVNLVHRATMARGILTMIQNGQLLHASALPTPESKDGPNFLRWLF